MQGVRSWQDFVGQMLTVLLEWDCWGCCGKNLSICHWIILRILSFTNNARKIEGLLWIFIDTDFVNAKQFYIVLSRQGVLVSACAVFTSFTSWVIRSKSPESQSKVTDFLDSKNYQSNHQKFQILFHLSDRFLLSCRRFQLIMSKEYYKGNVISSLLYRQVLFKFSGCYLSF